MNNYSQDGGGNEKSLLVSCLPLILNFIRDKDSGLITQHLTQAAKLLVNPLSPTSAGISSSNETLKTFAKLQGDLKSLWPSESIFRKQRRRGHEIELPNSKDIYFILSKHDPLTWYLVVLTTLQQVDPGILPTNITQSSRYAVSSRRTPKLRKQLANSPEVKAIEQLPYKTYIAFGEFCSFVHDSVSIPLRSKLCSLLTKVFLFGKKFNVNNALDTQSFEQQPGVLFFYVTFCNSVFVNLPEAATNNFPTGIRFSTVQARKYHATIYRNIKFELWTELEQKIGLKDFFLLIDRKYLPLVNLLFESQNFHNICLSLIYRFYCLPTAWKIQIRVMWKKIGRKRGGKAKTFQEWSWFNDRVSFKQGKSGVRYLPTQAQNHFKYLKSLDKSYVGSSSTVSQIINEFIEFQLTFSHSLEAFLRHFVTEVKLVASGTIGRGAKEALDFSVESCRRLLGDHLVRLMRSSSAFAAQLELFTILPSFEKESKILVFCQVLQNNLEELTQTFSWFNSQLNLNKEHLDQVVSRSSSASKANKHLDFMLLYREFQNSVLSGNNIVNDHVSRKYFKHLKTEVDKILSAGLYHFPKLPLFLERMLKELQKVRKNPANNLIPSPELLEVELEQVEATWLMFKSALAKVDQAIQIRNTPPASPSFLNRSNMSVSPRRPKFRRADSDAAVSSFSRSNFGSSFFR
eukprot:snap_masked-scaffold_1-processed-gene-4.23-mRNA-1 protein AED:1.00 eAED:1.00 QI:0/-1/0/0/-1/1/1/0/686